MNGAIQVRLNFGLDTADISLIQGIEKALDEALEPSGFVRTTSGKGGVLLSSIIASMRTLILQL